MGKMDYERSRAELERYETELPQLSPIIGLNRQILDIQESVRASLGPAPAVSAWGLDNLNAAVSAMGSKSPPIPGDIFRDAASKLARAFSDVSVASFPLERIMSLPQLQGDDVAAIADDLLGSQLDLEAVAENSGKGSLNGEQVVQERVVLDEFPTESVDENE